MVTSTKTGREAAKDVADQLRAEQAEKEGKEIAVKEDIKKDLAVKGLNSMQLPQSTLDFFNQTAGAGMENMDDRPKLPFLLKVTEANSTNELRSGALCPAGHFYYGPDMEDVGEEIAVSIATISGKFHTKVEPNETDKAKGATPSAKFTQMVAGYFLSNGKPFIMFVTGKRLSKMWEFAEEIRPFTKLKPVSVPMYAFKVSLRLQSEKNNYGRSHIILYDIVRNGAGEMQIVTDPKALASYHSGIEKLNAMIKGFIDHNAVDKDTLELISDRPIPIEDRASAALELARPVVEAEAGRVTTAVTEGQQEGDPNVINAEDIPF